MKNGGLQSTRARVLLTALTAGMMVLIFFFSTETAEQSDETSGMITQQMITILYPDFPDYPDVQQQEMYDHVQLVVRKTAHFTEYALLGLLMRLCLESWFGRRNKLSPAALAAGTVYACTDEIHQIMTDGRSGQWNDVLIDSVGVLTGVLVIAWILRLIRERKAQKGTDKT